MPDTVRNTFFGSAGTNLSGVPGIPFNGLAEGFWDDTLIWVDSDIWEDDPGILGGTLFPAFLETSLPTGDPNVSITQLPDAPATTGEHYLFDFYNRIWLYPDFIDFGTINADESQPFNVWNAFFVPKMMTGVTEPLDLSVTTSVLTPTTFSALELRTYSATAFASGPAKLDATFTFNFSGAQPVNLAVRGTRAELWPFQPNWNSSPKVTVEYKTEIITSRSGREQRRAQRLWPRKVIEFDVLVEGGSYIDLKRLLTRWQNKTFIVPDVTRSVAIPNAVSSGTQVIPMGSAPWWAVAGADVIIQTPISAYKWRQSVHGIASVSGGNITLADATNQNWPVGTTICPALLSLAGADIAVNPQTSTVADVKVTFAVDPGSEPRVLHPDAPTTFDGREVLTWRTNWRDVPQTNWLYPMEQVDYGRGRIETVRPIQFSTSARRISMMAKTAAEAERHLAQFMRMRGQRGEFWADSGEPDLIPKGTTPPGNNIIKVAGGDFYDTYSGDTVHSALQFVMKDGTVHRTKILGMALNAGDTDVTIETALGQPVSEATVERVSWLRVCRHATDEMSLEWITDSVVETQITVQTLEALDAE